MAKPQLSLKRRLLRLFLWLAGIAVAFFTYGALLGWQTTCFLNRFDGKGNKTNAAADSPAWESEEAAI